MRLVGNFSKHGPFYRKIENSTLCYGVWGALINDWNCNRNTFAVARPAVEAQMKHMHLCVIGENICLFYWKRMNPSYFGTSVRPNKGRAQFTCRFHLNIYHIFTSPYVKLMLLWQKEEHSPWTRISRSC